MQSGVGAMRLRAVATGLRALMGGAIVALSMTAALPRPVAADCSGWNLYNDFRTSPNQANPSPDSCGNSAVWYFDRSLAATHDPSQYAPLDTYTDNFSSAVGLDGWFNSTPDLLPHILKNTNTSAVTLSTVTIPANSIDVHPGSGVDSTHGSYFVLGWRSPITGSINVAGGVTDNDPHCGDGIKWSVDVFKNQSNTILNDGSYTNGGSQQFAQGSGGAGSMTNVPVSSGDTLYFVIDPNVDYFCDSTGLDVTITPVPPTPVPEAPGAILLPLMGVAAGGSVLAYKLRRNRRNASAGA
jgi:hypothetical protein